MEDIARDETLVWEQAHKLGLNMLGNYGNYKLIDSNTGLYVGTRMSMAEVLGYLHRKQFTTNSNRSRYDDTTVYDSAA